jgi:hypothetical protein
MSTPSMIWECYIDPTSRPHPAAVCLTLKLECTVATQNTHSSTRWTTQSPRKPFAFQMLMCGVCCITSTCNWQPGMVVLSSG